MWSGASLHCPQVALDMPSLFPLFQSNLGVSGLFMLDFMHTAIAVLYERVIRLAPVAFRQQAFECPAVVPPSRKGGEPFSHMTGATAASYSNSMVKVVHDSCVPHSQALPPLRLACVCLRQIPPVCSLRRACSVRDLSGPHFNGRSRAQAPPPPPPAPPLPSPFLAILQFTPGTSKNACAHAPGPCAMRG
jgi:hypothetical protein